MTRGNNTDHTLYNIGSRTNVGVLGCWVLEWGVGWKVGVLGVGCGWVGVWVGEVGVGGSRGKKEDISWAYTHTHSHTLALSVFLMEDYSIFYILLVFYFLFFVSCHGRVKVTI